MARKVLLALLGVTSLCLFSRAFCQQEVKIGFISLKKVSQDSLKREAFDEELKKLADEKRGPLDAVKQEIADLETAKSLSGPEQAKKTEQEIQQKNRVLVKLVRELRAEIDKRRLSFETELLDDIGEAVKEVAEEKGYTWVLYDEVLLYKDESADLTLRVLVKMNDKYIASRSQPESKPEEKAPDEEGGEVSSGREKVPVSEEDALIEDVVKNGAGDRYTIKEIQPRTGWPPGSILMKSEGGRLRFVSQFPKDMTASDGILSAPMGNQSVWRFVGKAPLSGYTFEAPDENRPLTFILLEEIGLVHLYGRGSVTFPDGRSVTIEEEGLSLRGARPQAGDRAHGGYVRLVGGHGAWR